MQGEKMPTKGLRSFLGVTLEEKLSVLGDALGKMVTFHLAGREKPVQGKIAEVRKEGVCLVSSVGPSAHVPIPIIQILEMICT